MCLLLCVSVGVSLPPLQAPQGPFIIWPSRVLKSLQARPPHHLLLISLHVETLQTHTHAYTHMHAHTRTHTACSIFYFPLLPLWIPKLLFTLLVWFTFVNLPNFSQNTYALFCVLWKHQVLMFNIGHLKHLALII